MILTGGNVSRAAKRLKIEPRELRIIISKHGRLKDAVLEGHERMLDKAEANILKALRGDNTTMQLHAARHIVRTSGRW